MTCPNCGYQRFSEGGRRYWCDGVQRVFLFCRKCGTGVAKPLEPKREGMAEAYTSR